MLPASVLAKREGLHSWVGACQGLRQAGASRRKERAKSPQPAIGMTRALVLLLARRAHRSRSGTRNASHTARHTTLTSSPSASACRTVLLPSADRA